MPADAYLDWSGDFGFGPANDIRLAVGDTFSNQRVIRRLMTNPVIRDGGGVVVEPAGDKFNPNYGAGIGRFVEATMDDYSAAERDARVRNAMREEPVVDQTQTIHVQHLRLPKQSREYMLLRYTTIEGDPATTGFGV